MTLSSSLTTYGVPTTRLGDQAVCGTASGVQDYQELGVKDRGAEIRGIVEEVIRVSR